MKVHNLQLAAGLCAAALLGAAGLALAASGGPTVTLSTTASSTTNATSVPVTASFSENVNGFTAADASTSNATISSFSGSGATYTFMLNPSSQGAFSVSIPADVATSASSSLGNQQSNTLSFTFDSVAPVLTTVTPVPATSTSATPSLTFNSTQAGTIALSGGCTSTTTSAASGTNTITFNALANGSYTCALRVTDAAGNVSNSLPVNFTVAVPSTVSLSNIAVSNIATSSATITWSTNVPAMGFVSYGTTSNYGATTTAETTASTTHSVTLSNLQEATLYHFQVSETSASSTATSSDMTFTTASTASTTPLSIVSITPVTTSGIADNLFSDGWLWVIHFTVPTNEDALRIRFSDWGNASSSFPTANNVQIWSPQSSNASSSSAILESNNSYGGWLYLTGDTNTALPGRQIDLDVQVKIPFGTLPGAYSSNFTAQTYPSSATSTATSTP